MSLLMAAALLLPAPADASQADAQACVRSKIWDGYSDGWAVRTAVAAELDQGQRKVYTVTLYEGVEYRIQGCGDDGVLDVDVAIYDENGRLVKRDATKDRQPELIFRPDRSGDYFLVMYARHLAAPGTPAGIAMAVTYR